MGTQATFRNRRIVILTHEFDAFEETAYYMGGLARLWRERGIEVIVQSGLGPKLEADLLVLHVDLTIVPQEYLAYARQYPVVLNGGTVDISKRHISRQLVMRESNYEGPVVVKSDLNCNGARETHFARQTAPVRRLAGRVLQKLSGKKRRADYEVFASARDVPASIWSDESLIVERFTPERVGEEYVARTYHFLGDREICNALYSREAIMRPGNILRREPEADVPAGLRHRRAELGFDFGKFDYVVVDGEVIVFDANRTPTEGDVSAEILAQRYGLLANGIDSFFPAS